MTRVVVPNHGDTHCPGGPDPISCLGVQVFRAALTGDDLENVNDSPKFIDWTHWEQTFNSSIFEPRKTTGGTDPVMGTDLMRSVSLLAPGRYSFHLGLHIDETTWDGTLAVAFNDANTIFGYHDVIHQGFETRDLGGADEGTGFSDFMFFNWAHVYPLWDPFEVDDPHTVLCNWRVSSNSSVDLTVTDATLEIHYLPVTG